MPTPKKTTPAKKTAGKKAVPAKKTTTRKTAEPKKAPWEILTKTPKDSAYFDDPTAVVTTRVSKTLKKAVTVKAKTLGLSEAAWVRMLLIDAVS